MRRKYEHCGAETQRAGCNDINPLFPRPIQKIKLRVVKKLLARNKWKYKPSIPEFPAVKITKESIPKKVIRYIIRAGIQAPSGDNVQPWEFSFKDNNIFLYLNRDADPSFFNINQIASIISCGAVLENMRIAASAFDLNTNINYLPSGIEDDLMASIELIYNETSINPLFASIWKRNTNRTFYEITFPSINCTILLAIDITLGS